MFCSQCGSQVPDNAKFCTRCGFRFPTAGDPPPAVKAPVPGAPAGDAPADAPAYPRTPATPAAVQAAPAADPPVPQAHEPYSAPEAETPPAPEKETPPAPEAETPPTPKPENPQAPQAFEPGPAPQGYTPPPQGYTPPPQGYTPPSQAYPSQAPQAYPPQAPQAYLSKDPQTYPSPVHPAREPGGGPLNGPATGFDLLRRLGRSPVFLIAVIAFTAFAVLMAVLEVSLIDVADTIESEIRRSEGSNAIPSGLLVTISTVSAAVTLLLIALTAAGMWITLAAAAKKTEGARTTGGLTLIQVVTIILLVLFCLMSAAMLISLVAGKESFCNLFRSLAEDLDRGADPEEAASVGYLILLGAFAVSTILTILYFAGILRTIGTMRRTMRSGVPDKRVSLFVAVMNFLLALNYAAVPVLTKRWLDWMLEQAEVKKGSAAKVMRMLGLDSVSSLSFACAAGLGLSLICFGIFLFQYRSGMKKAMQSAEAG